MMMKDFTTSVVSDLENGLKMKDVQFLNIVSIFLIKILVHSFCFLKISLKKATHL